MKRSLQEVIELLVFALIVLLVGTGLLWLVGWLLGLVGALFKIVAAVIWTLLKYIIPIAFVAGAIYFLVRLARDRPEPEKGRTEAGTAAASGPEATPAATPPPPSPAPPIVDVEVDEGAEATTSTPPVETDESPDMGEEELDERLDTDEDVAAREAGGDSARDADDERTA